MTDLKEFEFIELNWHQPSNWKKSYVLKFDEEIIATLNHESIWSKTAIGKTSVGEYSLKISGIFKPEFTIRENGQSADLIKISVKLTQTTIPITLPSGNTYEWRKVGVMKNEYGWYINDEIIYDFNFVISLTDKRRLKTTFTKSNISNEDLSFLLLIGSYFMFSIQQNSGA